MQNIELLKKAVDSVKVFVQKAVKPLQEEIETLKGELKNLPKPEKGEKGDPGPVGPSGEKGQDGQDADPELIKQLVADEVAKIPAPKDGDKGDQGEKGQDGKNGDNGKDGENGENGSDGRDGRDGIDGVDGLDIEVLPAINENKSYPRGTYATHNGGLWKTVKATDGMDGWECVINGVADFEVDYDGERNFNIKMIASNGEIKEKSFDVPVMIYKNVYKETDYKKGDTVTFAGSLWYANKETKERPGAGSKDWTLAAKRGADGKDKS